MKYTKAIRERFRSKPVFSLNELRTFLSKSGISDSYLRLLVHNMQKSGELKRITSGKYTFADEMQVVGLAYAPYYYGLQDALSLHNLWEQETVPVVITTRKARGGKREFLGNNYVVRRIGRKYFFGYETVRYGDFWVNVSDKEKTLIDFAHFNVPLDGEALDNLETGMRPEVMKEYLGRMPVRTRAKAVLLLNKAKRKKRKI